MGAIVSMMAEGDSCSADLFSPLENEPAPFSGASVAFEFFPFLGGGFKDEVDPQFLADSSQEIGVDPGAAREFSVDMDSVDFEEEGSPCLGWRGGGRGGSRESLPPLRATATFRSLFPGGRSRKWPF